ncbi:MAG: hypothetical protein Q8O67_31230 [Deltaproteobacteria bacterium]|nr:hypothetical protein [Deltaproteobacteria bacterium]
MRVPGLVVVVATVTALVGCPEELPIQMWVDGFQPENVRFEIETLGPQSAEQLKAIKARPNVDGALLLPPGSCPAPGCRAALVSLFVTNRSGEKEPPPVVRLAVPAGRAARQPVVFQANDIDPGRIGRIRWLVELWPEERDLTATLSSSVRLLVSDPTPPAPPPPDPVPPG